jgi:hypothetical protein
LHSENIPRGAYAPRSWVHDVRSVQDARFAMRRCSSGQERRHFRELAGFCTSLLHSELVTLGSAWQSPPRPRRFSIGLLLSELAAAVRFWLGFLGLSAILHRLATFRIGNAGPSLAKPAPATAIFHRLASFRIGNGGAILARLPWAFGDFAPACYVPNWRRVHRAWRLAVANAGSRNPSKIATCGHSLPQSVHEDAEDT